MVQPQSNILKAQKHASIELLFHLYGNVYYFKHWPRHFNVNDMHLFCNPDKWTGSLCRHIQIYIKLTVVNKPIVKFLS